MSTLWTASSLCQGMPSSCQCFWAVLPVCPCSKAAPAWISVTVHCVNPFVVLSLCQGSELRRLCAKALSHWAHVFAPCYQCVHALRLRLPGSKASLHCQVLDCAKHLQFFVLSCPPNLCLQSCHMIGQENPTMSNSRCRWALFPRCKCFNAWCVVSRHGPVSKNSVKRKYVAKTITYIFFNHNACQLHYQFGTFAAPHCQTCQLEYCLTGTFAAHRVSKAQVIYNVGVMFSQIFDLHGLHMTMKTSCNWTITLLYTVYDCSGHIRAFQLHSMFAHGWQHGNNMFINLSRMWL